MRLRPRAILLTAFVAAVVVFCVVQDRVTAEGARQYVALQRAALEGGGQMVTIEGTVAPAVARSVRQGLLWGSVVLGGGVAVAVVAQRRERRVSRRVSGGA